MFKAVVPEVLAKYGVMYTKIFPAQKGYRNESYRIELFDHKEVNLIFYKQEPAIVERVNRADAVASIAHEADLPVRIRLDPRLLQLRKDSIVGLYSYLPGSTIAWEAYTMKHIKLLGWAMADLHRALALGSSGPLDDHTAAKELEKIVDTMRDYFKREGVQTAMQQKLGIALSVSELVRCSAPLKSLATHPEQQMLHLDMVRGNVLFSSNAPKQPWEIGGISITGIIDFEKTAYGHVLFDIARTLAFLLVDCASKDSVKIHKYFVASGYEKRGHHSLNLTTKYGGQTYASMLADLVNIYLLYDLYKFLRHTPYESLAQNHHYVQTRNILIDKGMVRYL